MAIEGGEYGCVLNSRKVWGNIPVGVWKDAQGVVSLETVLAGVHTMGYRVEVVGGGCAGTGRIIRGMVFTRRENDSHLFMTPFDGYGQDERRGGQVRVAYRDVINTFDKRQWHSHDPG